MWENGSGEQQKMFDEDGNPLTTQDVTLPLLVISQKGMWKKIKAEDAVI